MSNMYLIYMDMINEDRFTYRVLIRRLRGSVMNLRYLNYDGTLRVFKLNEPPSLEWWRDKAEKGDTARYVAGLYLNVGDRFFRRKKCNSNFWVGKDIVLCHGPFETSSAVLLLDTICWKEAQLSEPAVEILLYHHPNETSLVVLSHGNINLVLSSNFRV